MILKVKECWDANFFFFCLHVFRVEDSTPLKREGQNIPVEKRQVKRNISMCLHPWPPQITALAKKRLMFEVWATSWRIGPVEIPSMWDLGDHWAEPSKPKECEAWLTAQHFFFFFFSLKRFLVLLHDFWQSTRVQRPGLTGRCTRVTLFHIYNSFYIGQQHFSNRVNTFPQSCHPQHFGNRACTLQICLSLLGLNLVTLAIFDTTVFYLVIVLVSVVGVHLCLVTFPPLCLFKWHQFSLRARLSLCACLCLSSLLTFERNPVCYYRLLGFLSVWNQASQCFTSTAYGPSNSCMQNNTNTWWCIRCVWVPVVMWKCATFLQ